MTTPFHRVRLQLKGLYFCTAAYYMLCCFVAPASPVIETSKALEGGRPPTSRPYINCPPKGLE